jgi:S-adenosyl-L-methionine hydrolase (adenosine-forming)
LAQLGGKLDQTIPVNSISFLTDYGLADEFVGVCKGVIRQLAPETHVVDITHDVPAFDIRAGSLALVRSVQYLPDGVVLAIVDPGVGGSRRAIAVEAGEKSEYVFVGPDNGLLAPAVAMLGGAKRAVHLTNESYHLVAPGTTFAGRDIFAPVAAYLTTGVDLLEFGEEIDPVTLLPGVLPLSRFEPDEPGGAAVFGEVLWVDRFGNAQLNLGPEDLEPLAAMGESHLEEGDALTLTWNQNARTIRLRPNYSAIKAGEIGLVVDSYGLLSICVDQGSASRELGLGTTLSVRLSVPTQ